MFPVSEECLNSRKHYIMLGDPQLTFSSFFFCPSELQKVVLYCFMRPMEGTQWSRAVCLDTPCLQKTV